MYYVCMHTLFLDTGSHSVAQVALKHGIVYSQD